MAAFCRIGARHVGPQHRSLGLGLGTSATIRAGGRGRGRTRVTVGVGVRVRAAIKDSVGVQSGESLPPGGFGASEVSGASGPHGHLRPLPLATNCWLEALQGVGGGG